MKLIIHFAAYMSVSLGATDEHPSITKITANSTDTDVVARYGGNWEIYWALVFPGLLSVLLSLAVIWKNERKIVQMKGVYREAEIQMFVNQDY